MSKAMLKVTQIKSVIGKPRKQRRIMEGLGLRKMQQSVILENTPSIRGMIKKVIHLVRVEEHNE